MQAITTKLIKIGTQNVEQFDEWEKSMKSTINTTMKEPYLAQEIFYRGKEVPVLTGTTTTATSGSNVTVTSADIEKWWNTELKLQGLLAQRCHESLESLLHENTTSHEQYKAVVKKIRDLGFGNYDDVLYKMMGTKQQVGDRIMPLDEYLIKINRELANLKAVTDSKTPQQVTEEFEVKWIAHGLSERLFLNIKIEYGDKLIPGTKKLAFLEILRNAHHIGLGNNIDGERIIHPDGTMKWARASKGFQGKWGEDRAVDKGKDMETRKCFHCKRPGHLRRDCRAKCTWDQCRMTQCTTGGTPKGNFVKNIKIDGVKGIKFQGLDGIGTGKPAYKSVPAGDGWGRAMLGRGMIGKKETIMETANKSAKPMENTERVCIDTGSTRTGLNKEHYFLPGSLRPGNHHATTTITGEIIRPSLIGTAVVRLCSLDRRQFAIIQMEDVPLMEEYPESVLGFQNVKNLNDIDVIVPPKDDRGQSSLEIYFKGDLWERITPAKDNLYYTHISACSKVEMEEFAEIMERANFGPIIQKDKSVSKDTVHQRYGHPGAIRQKKLEIELMKSGYNIQGELTDCRTCQLAKMRPHRYPELEAARREKMLPGEKWSHDLSGPVAVAPVGFSGGKYRSLMVDYNSGYYVAQILNSKTEAAGHIFAVKWKVDGLFGQGRMRYLKTDNAGEVTSKANRKCFKEEGIQLSNTPPYSHQANGDIERRMQMNENTTMSLLIGASADKKFWGYACMYAAIIDQFVPFTRSQDSARATAHQRFYGEKSEQCDHLRV